MGQHMSEAQLEALAAEVASRKKDPYTAVNEYSGGLPDWEKKSNPAGEES